MKYRIGDTVLIEYRDGVIITKIAHVGSYIISTNTKDASVHFNEEKDIICKQPLIATPLLNIGPTAWFKDFEQDNEGFIIKININKSGSSITMEAHTPHTPRLSCKTIKHIFGIEEKVYCDHFWKKYVGFTDIYNYCHYCGEKQI